jgi:hypothetical protein
MAIHLRQNQQRQKPGSFFKIFRGLKRLSGLKMEALKNKKIVFKVRNVNKQRTISEYNTALLHPSKNINYGRFMTKSVLIFFCVLFLSACADKENYYQAVLAEIQSEQDVKDYKIDPEYITKCIVDTSAKEMPGLFPFDPARITAYRNYVKMLTLKKAKDPKKVMMELRSDFGSAKELSDAHSNYTESMLECISATLIEKEK